MDAITLPPDAPLPDDVPTLQALVRQLLVELARLRAENAELKNKLDAALRHRFGRRSERRSKRRQPKADDDASPRRHEHGRSPLPDHLERREIVHDLTAAEQLCPCCGHPRVCIGEQTAEQLDYEPAKPFVRRTIKKSYACRHCDPATVPPEQRLQTAGPLEVGPLAKGLCGPGLLTHVITAKFADHTPLHRLSEQLRRVGVHVACSTMGDWLRQAADLLRPLYDLMHQQVLRSRVIHADDTGVKLRVGGVPRTHKAHLWVAIGDADSPYVVFDFTSGYTADGPRRFFAGYSGYLQADALAQYEGLYREQDVKHVGCWAHARRKFVAALDTGDPTAERAVEWIAELYAIERTLPPLIAPSAEPLIGLARRLREEERRRLRHERASPVLASLKNWLAEQQRTTLPKTPLGQAVGYTLNNWASLTRYREQGYLSIDNNLAERTLRTVAVGRNNWGVLGSERGGETAAVLYTLVGTCRHLGLDVFAYLREALPGIFTMGSSPPVEALRPWLPDRWGESPRAASE